MQTTTDEFVLPPDTGNRKQRILVAEDVMVIAYRMTKGLEEQGFDVDHAEDGEQCLEKIESFKPDLIILDLMMPKIHGIDVLKTLKSNPETAQIGVIVCTSQNFTTEQRTAEQLGVFDFISKPIQLDELLTKVERFFLPSDTNEQQPLGHQEVSKEVEAFHPTLDTSRSCFRLWGTRGSIPVSGTQYARHGGNTSCLAVSSGDELFIFDTGSGIRDLGLELMKDGPRNIHLLITHTHWDHIQGFPFFTPAYVPGFDITIYGAHGFGKNLEALFRGQLDMDYFPAQMKDMNANLEFITLTDSPVQIDGYQIEWTYAHHPGATLAYKIGVDGKQICWMPDNEIFKGYLGPPDDISINSNIVTDYLPLIEFLSDVDILISEVQYTNDEYPNKIGWGHTCVSNACVLMKLAQIKKWIVTHYDPMHSDAFLEDQLNLTLQLMERISHSIDISHGYDGMIKYL